MLIITSINNSEFEILSVSIFSKIFEELRPFLQELVLGEIAALLSSGGFEVEK